MKKNILFIHSHLNYGGAEKMLAFVANSLTNDFNVHIGLVESKEIVHTLNPEISIHEMDIFNHNKSLKEMGIAKSYKYFKEIIDSIRKIENMTNPDLTIAFSDRLSLLSFISLKKRNTKFMFSQRSDPFLLPKLWKIITFYLYKRSDHVVFQTNEARDSYKFVDVNHTSIIPNPIPDSVLIVNKPQNTTKDNKIISVGRLEYRKGFDILIKSFEKVVKIYPSHRLYIYGDGQERDRLEKLIDKLNLTSNVFLPGYSKDINNLMLSSDMFVLSSRSEGIPNVLLEAISLGLPVISTDCSPGGARLVLNNGLAGELVENEDIENLSSAIIKYIENPVLRYNKAVVASEYVQIFEAEKIKLLWQNTVKKLI